ncbi:hypothetical protein D0860_07277 [Hortaea werneckii]|uniref:O-methyltransferase C-terminal domain-containing protein n=1 Tax=Hortaea werneckii TaxID=91943 RepID=A0A3M7GMG6_HORWE|nr:hypothetical protein D0860_07277 [Hortaea werneckii]
MGTTDISPDPMPNEPQSNNHSEHAVLNLSRRPDTNPPPRYPPTVPISTALLPSDDAAVPDLLHRIQVTGQDYTANHLHHAHSDRNQKNSVRLALLSHARALVRALETPRETMSKHCWAEPSAATCLAVGVDTGLFHYLSCDDAGCPCMKGWGGGGGGEEGEQGAGKGMGETYSSSPSSVSHPSQTSNDPDLQNPSQDHIPAATAAAAAATANGTTPPSQWKTPKPKSLPFLSARTGIPPSLLSRLLRHLTSMSHIRQPSPTTFQPTPFSSALTHPTIGDGYPVILASLPALTCFPQYARLTDYREPDDPGKGPYQFGVRTDRGFFEDVGVKRPLGEEFGNLMGGYRRGRRSWWEEGVYPVRERLVRGAGLEEGEGDEGKVLLVDVGRGFGHDVREFAAGFGDVVGMERGKGRMVLEDLPEVVRCRGGEEVRIERVGCDFFKENPVQGARAYYLHSVLHDWPKPLASAILTRIAQAMEPGYSKLLIHENCIPALGAHWEATALDMMMLGLVASKERTEHEWRELIGATVRQDGYRLRVVGIWGDGEEEGVESLIECELV